MKEKATLEWIGTGSGLNPVLGNTSFMVKGNERTLLVDCGSTVPLELMKTGRIGEITDVLLTHAHADHIGGLEGFAFMNYFALRNRGDKRPNLYVGSEDFAHALWENSLRGGMTKIQTDTNEPLDANIETYFKVHTGKRVQVSGLPEATLFETPHVHGLENYGVKFGDDVFYSGDTIRSPETDAKLIFQDAQFFNGGVHISYDELKSNLSSEVKARTYLVHLGGGYDAKNPKEDGFAGFVKPGDKFDI